MRNMRLEIQKDGISISKVFIYQKSEDEGGEIYQVEYHRFMEKNPKTCFEVRYKSEEGIEKLMLKIYREMDRLKNNNSKK